MVGSCMYTMTQTRVDISFPIQWLTRGFQSPITPHLHAAKNLIRYLNGSKTLAICYGRTFSGNTEVFDPKIPPLLVPKAFSDSDFAGDKATSKSTYGYLITIANGPVSWKSKRAAIIALSTTEAETDALIETIREVLWLKNLYKELKTPIKAPINLKENNKGSIITAYNPALHNRTKHTLLKF